MLAYIVLIILAGALVVLIAIMLVNATRIKPTPVKKPLPQSLEMGDDEAVERFREMLRSATIWGAENPEADHTPFDEFAPKLQKLYPSVFENLELTIVNTYGIMLRWRGADPSLSPVILTAHHDVVEANVKGWTHDPFGAEITDGKIFARGSVDTKCILAALLEATARLLAEGYVPPRDIILFSTNSEEDSGDTTPKMIELLQEQGISPYFVLDEGGAVIDKAPLGVKCQFAAIGVSEKGIFNALITTNAPGGHAATPALGNATNKLVTGLNKLQNNPAPAKLAAPIEAMLKELAAYGGFGLKIVFGNLWLLRPLVLKIMKGDPETAAMVRTTHAFTQLEGSRAHNVIPKQAKATVNVRIDPSESIEIALDRIKSHFDAETEFALSDANSPSPISPFEDEVFDYLRRIIHSVYPNAGIAPYVQSSCSDARHFHQHYLRVYRFAGFLFKAEERASIHGQDEHLS
ncbi:MAG: M20/M25/M40 family metallo-hydrolase, partial [Eggerthellaceae bacterium]|nr:M20/M25/M40 family metallo-hydrolase [Eggerthellaceae bacterium]